MENTGLQLSDLKVSNLPELQGWKEKQEQLVTDNPFIEIIDNKTYELACKSRTNLLKGRTSLEGQEKTIASKLVAFRKEIGAKTKELIDITEPHEDKQQQEVKRYENIKAQAKAEEERIERERIEKIKTKIDLFESDSYRIIQETNIENVEMHKTMLDAFVNDEFDYEEYDILFEQARMRIQASWDLKCNDIQEKEEQRKRNEQLEKENAEAKRIADLQASRLTEILPYIPFGEFVHVTALSELEDSEYERILTSKKALFEADAKEKQEAQDKLNSKILEEKESIYEIRKNRLEELGMNYSNEHDTFWLDENEDYILLQDDVFDYSQLEFEKTFAEVKGIIESVKEKIEREKLLLEAGFVFLEEANVFHYLIDNKPFIFISCKDIKEFERLEFEERVCYLINTIKKELEQREEAEAQIAIDLQLSKDDAERLKKENKAIVKRLSPDKFSLSGSLTKIGELVYYEISVAKFENEETELFRQAVNSKFAILIEGLLTELEKL